MSTSTIISLFDPVLDHPATKPGQAWAPCTGVFDAPMPAASRYFLLAEPDGLSDARAALAAIRRKAETSPRHPGPAADWQAEARPVRYRDIWDTASCIKDLEPVIQSVFKAFSGGNAAPEGQNRGDYLVLNLGGGTAAAKAALCLCALRAAKARGRRLSVFAVRFAPDRSPLRVDLLGDTAAAGILADAMNTRDPAFRQSLDLLERLVHRLRRERILLTGPTGAGKTHLARRTIEWLQAVDSNVTEKNSIVQNVAAIPPNLIESELFGHEQGAFTGAVRQHKGIFERAANGVVFLDEIGELAPSLQAKLLSVLDGHPFYRIGGTEPISSSFTLVCGTNRDLDAACAAGKFRPDLLQRVATWRFHVPGLRDRPDDLEPAFKRECVLWLREHGRQIRFEKRPKSATAPARDAWARCLELARRIPWHGNYRELHASFVHMAMWAEKGLVTEAVVEAELLPKLEAAAPEDPSFPLPANVDLASLAKLAAALDACKAARNANEAGRLLFDARRRASEANGASFNGSAAIQRLFAEFGLKLSFSNGSPTLSLLPGKNGAPALLDL